MLHWFVMTLTMAAIQGMMSASPGNELKGAEKGLTRLGSAVAQGLKFIIDQK